MTKFAFWNINRKRLERLIGKLAAIHDLDLIMLAESEVPRRDGLEALQISTGYDYRFLGEMPRPGSASSRLHVYTRLGISALESVSFTGQVNRTKFFRLHRQGSFEIDTLLVLAHAPSKHLGSGHDDQRKFFGNSAPTIKLAEKQIGHRNTILVGDLNVDPFDEGLASVHGIQGVSAKGIARGGHREYNGRSHGFFYNPMWGEYRDRRESPASDEPETPGTYYFKKNPGHHLYWHMYDQVLIRPALIDRFSADGLEIVGRVGPEPLVSTAGLPFPSDHLPILFCVDLNEEFADAGR